MLKLTEAQKRTLVADGTFTAEEVEKVCSKRTADSVMDSLRNTGRIMFFTKDVITIKSQSGVICSTITINLKNEEYGEDLTFCLPNVLDAWTYLKNISAFNPVMYQVDDEEPIKYEESMPYIHRFG